MTFTLTLKRSEVSGHAGAIQGVSLIDIGRSLINVVTVLALHTQGGNGGARRGSCTTQRPQVRMLSPLPVSPLPVSPPPLSPPPAEMPFVNGLVNPSAARRVNDPPNSDDQECQNDIVLTPKL